MKPPAFQFYADTWLASLRVQLMTLAEEGAYIRCLAFCWRHGSIPSDPATLARLIGKGCDTTLASVVAQMFIPGSEPLTLVHERLEEERVKQAQWRAKCAAGGRAAKHSKGSTKDSVALRSPSPSPSPSPSSDSVSGLPSANTEREADKPPTRSPVSKPEIPTAEQWQAHRAAEHPSWPVNDAQAAWSFYEGNGWRTGKNPVKKWRACASTCFLRWQRENPQSFRPASSVPDNLK